MGMQQEVERLKERFHEQEKLLRECEALKVSSVWWFTLLLIIFLRYLFVNLLSFQGQVRMLLMRVAELEKKNLPVSN